MHKDGFHLVTVAFHVADVIFGRCQVMMIAEMQQHHHDHRDHHRSSLHIINHHYVGIIKQALYKQD